MIKFFRKYIRTITGLVCYGGGATMLLLNNVTTIVDFIYIVELVVIAIILSYLLDSQEIYNRKYIEHTEKVMTKMVKMIVDLREKLEEENENE